VVNRRRQQRGQRGTAKYAKHTKNMKFHHGGTRINTDKIEGH
jgi:hypothetical protein